MKRDFLFFLIVTLFYFLSLNSLFYTGGDNAHYLILAKSFAKGKGYCNINILGHPPETTYPPFFPFLLLPFVKIFGFSPIPPKIFVTLLGLGSFFIVRKLYKYDLSSFLLPFLIILNPLILEYSGVILTEIPYLFFSLLFIYFIDKKNLNFAIIFLIISIFTRLIGFSLLIAFIIWGKRKKISPLYYLIPLFLIIAWIARGYFLKESGYINSFFMVNPYNSQEGYLTLKCFFYRIIKNGGSYVLRDIPATFYSPFSKISIEYFHPIYILEMFIGSMLTFFTLSGFIKKFREKENIVPIYILIYFGFLLLWPWRGSRFLVPIIPFLTYYFIEGIERLRSKKFLSLFLFSFLFLFIFQDANLIKGRRKAHYPEEFESYFNAGYWIKENTPSNIHISTKNPFLFYIFAERECIGIPLEEPKKMFEIFRKKKINYIVVPPHSKGVKKSEDIQGNFLLPFLNSFKGNLKKIKSIGKPPTDIYLIKYKH